MNTTKKDSDKIDNTHQPVAVTKAKSSHIVGTGIGAVAGGAAVGAMVGTVAGPVGTVAGAVAGAAVGGLAGHSVAKAVNPSIEDAYWRENPRHQPFAKGRSFDDYSPAYRAGYEGYARFGAHGTFEDRETDLRKSYEAARPKLAWDEARPASRAAWQRFQDQPPKGSKAA